MATTTMTPKSRSRHDAGGTLSPADALAYDKAGTKMLALIEHFLCYMPFDLFHDETVWPTMQDQGPGRLPDVSVLAHRPWLAQGPLCGGFSDGSTTKLPSALKQTSVNSHLNISRLSVSPAGFPARALSPFPSSSSSSPSQPCSQYFPLPFVKYLEGKTRLS